MKTICCLIAIVAALAVHAHAQAALAEYDIPYITNGHERQKLDLYLPATGANLPLIVWIHGGGWWLGDKSECPLIDLTRGGFAIAGVGYRLSQHAPFPAQIEDCKGAIRWLRAHAAEYRIDPEKIGVWGASAGGHLAALVGTSGGTMEFDVGGNVGVSSRVQAVCDWCGPTDFSHFFDGQPADANSDLHDMFTSLLAGTIEQRGGLVQRANPIAFISSDDPPFLIMHGNLDGIVPISQSQLLADALGSAGVPVEFTVVPGAGHAFSSAALTAKVVAFFKRTLHVSQ
jgi:acetyl esterase/lipase